MLGYEGIAQRLRLTLEEEQQADTKLNFLAKSLINLRAIAVAPEVERRLSKWAYETLSAFAGNSAN